MSRMTVLEASVEIFTLLMESETFLSLMAGEMTSQAYADVALEAFEKVYDKVSDLEEYTLLEEDDLEDDLEEDEDAEE
ncbi:MAG: hypothetical protein H7Y22_13605 [Gemmatimonadaceae bacterium]|nr:hypothetical protein [Gloeobacterales cyanobacterium ES-bin-141]